MAEDSIICFKRKRVKHADLEGLVLKVDNDEYSGMPRVNVLQFTGFRWER